MVPRAKKKYTFYKTRSEREKSKETDDVQTQIMFLTLKYYIRSIHYKISF